MIGLCSPRRPNFFCNALVDLTSLVRQAGNGQLDRNPCWQRCKGSRYYKYVARSLAVPHPWGARPALILLNVGANTERAKDCWKKQANDGINAIVSDATDELLIRP